jgi:hypothetical protein
VRAFGRSDGLDQLYWYDLPDRGASTGPTRILVLPHPAYPPAGQPALGAHTTSTCGSGVTFTLFDELTVPSGVSQMTEYVGMYAVNVTSAAEHLQQRSVLAGAAVLRPQRTKPECF